MGRAGSLLTLAFLAAWEGRDEDALRLAGAYGSLRELVRGGPPTDFLLPLVGDPLAEARSRLTVEAAEQAREDGRKMSMEKAVAFARQVGHPPTANLML